MGFMEELESHLAQFTSEADELRSRLEHVNDLISHTQALLQEESRSTGLSSTALQFVTLSGNQPSANGHVSVGQPVSEAIYGMLQQGQTRFSDIVRRIPEEYPRIQVGHLAKGVSSALHHGIKSGRIRRIDRGIYALK